MFTNFLNHDIIMSTFMEGKLMSSKTNHSKKNILLIGPMATGKSSISYQLCKLLECFSPIHIDSLRWAYFQNTDYSPEVEKRIHRKEGFKGVNNYWKKYENALVLDVLSHLDKPSIIDFGAGQTVYDDPEMLKSIQEAFSKQENIFLILPYKDIEKSKKLLQKRLENRNYKYERKNPHLPILSRFTKRLKVNPDALELNSHFIESEANLTLASHIVYANDASPKKIAQAIVAVYNNRPLPRGKVEIIKNPYRIKPNKFFSSLKTEVYDIDSPLTLEQDITKNSSRETIFPEL